MAAQRVVVHHHAARGVDEQCAWLHGRELLRTEEACVPGPAVDMEADYVGGFEQLGERRHAASVPVGWAIRLVVEDHPHPERFSDVRQLGPDVAVPHDPQRAA